MKDSAQKAWRRLMEQSIVTKSGCRVARHTPEKSTYRYINVGGVTTSAHRLSYAVHYGPIPEGMVIRHKCHNCPCFEPSHILIGTVKDNNTDTINSGRHRPGGAKVSGAMWHAINLVKKGMSVRDAAETVGLYPTSIYRSKLYIEWKSKQKKS